MQKRKKKYFVNFIIIFDYSSSTVSIIVSHLQWFKLIYANENIILSINQLKTRKSKKKKRFCARQYVYTTKCREQNKNTTTKNYDYLFRKMTTKEKFSIKFLFENFDTFFVWLRCTALWYACIFFYSYGNCALKIIISKSLPFQKKKIIFCYYRFCFCCCQSCLSLLSFNCLLVFNFIWRFIADSNALIWEAKKKKKNCALVQIPKSSTFQ